MHTHTLVLHPRFSNTRRWAIAMVAVVALTLGAVFAAHAAPLDCSAGPTTRNVDLWAKPGTLAMADGTVVNVWGYASTSGDPAQVPGPVVQACAGDTVNVTLHNQLSEDSSLAIHGQTLAADRLGAASGSTKVYGFVAHAGTFVYQAGLTANGAQQAALGLYGALVVYPATTGQAYAPTATNANTLFDSESLVLLSEIDPALNGIAPAPINTAFNMHDYAPKYWLINGKSYPQTDAIQGAAGSKVLLRYANAGFEEHSMGMLGLSQTIIAENGYLLPYAHSAVAETVPPGSTLDTILTMPASGQYPLYDGNQHIDNNGAASASGFGGMFTYVSPGVSAGIGAPALIAAPKVAPQIAPPDSAPLPAPAQQPDSKTQPNQIGVPPAQ